MNISVARQVVLDIETTGMNKEKPYYIGHRVIEIGAVEIIKRRLTHRYFHTYLNPGCSINQEAFNIHGISEHFLHDKPKFSEIVNDFLNFISGDELIIHNAPFDVSFIDYELFLLNNNVKKITSLCKVIDTLQLARKLFPGKRNNLDILCERYCIDNSVRNFHNALVDAKLLANVFLSMTGGQISMSFMDNNNTSGITNNVNNYEKNMLYELKEREKSFIKIIYANSNEIMAHEKYLDILQKSSGNFCVWRKNI